MKAIITFGTTEGYFHNNEKNVSSTVAEDVLKFQEEISTETNGCFVSGILSEGKALYSHSWGCPQGGENIYVFSATHNPEFANLNDWLTAAKMLAEKIKKGFQQSAVTLEFVESALIYLRD